MTPQERSRDLALQKKYGITLAEYNEMLLKQGGGCWICGKPGVTRSLHVDHDHKWKNLPVKYEKGHWGNDVWRWHATTEYRGGTYMEEARTKPEVSKKIKIKVKRASIRGLLCMGCNTGLRKYSDNPDRLARAAVYLSRFINKTSSRGSNIQENK